MSIDSAQSAFHFVFRDFNGCFIEAPIFNLCYNSTETMEYNSENMYTNMIMFTFTFDKKKFDSIKHLIRAIVPDKQIAIQSNYCLLACY